MNVRTAVAMLCGPAAIAIGVVLHPATGDQAVPAPAVAAGQTWTVGADLPPGRYETTADVGGHCHWEITRAGPAGTEVVASDLVRGGRATVTLRIGDVFTAHRCGTWHHTGTTPPAA